MVIVLNCCFADSITNARFVFVTVFTRASGCFYRCTDAFIVTRVSALLSLTLVRL